MKSTQGTRIILSGALLLLSFGVSNVVGAQTQTDCTPVPESKILKDYIYGYAPVAMEATRAILTAVSDNTTNPGQAPVNQFAYGTKLATPNDTLIVRPNADTLFTGAWLDLSREPIILHVPDVAGRYYLIPMLDAYSNEFASVGSRTTGGGEGNYAIVGPRWRGYMSDRVNAVIQAPTNTVWLLGRTLVNGPADLQNAVDVTKQYQLIPLSSYRTFLETGSYTPPMNVPVTQPSPDFFSFPVTNAMGFRMPELFGVLGKYALGNPPPPDQFLTASALVLNGFINQNQLNADVASQADAAMINELRCTANTENGWSFNLGVGNYGDNYLLRAAVAKTGFGANIPVDAAYMHAANAATGTRLMGANNYVIHFAPGQTPPEHGFWSITVYDSNGFLIPNAINRFDVGSATGLVANTDGSLDVFLQTAEPRTMQSNWLPIPADFFSLTLRIYWPDPSVLSGGWQPPSVELATSPLP